jgi:hypothetical protein
VEVLLLVEVVFELILEVRLVWAEVDLVDLKHRWGELNEVYVDQVNQDIVDHFVDQNLLDQNIVVVVVDLLVDQNLLDLALLDRSLVDQNIVVAGERVQSNQEILNVGGIVVEVDRVDRILEFQVVVDDRLLFEDNHILQMEQQPDCFHLLVILQLMELELQSIV